MSTNLHEKDREHIEAVIDEKYESSALKEHIPNLLAKDTPNYLVEYGIRIDDGAMVFHFFAPKQRSDWDPSYKMSKRLERILNQEPYVGMVAVADYVPEVQSFCIILRGLGRSPDPWILVDRLFDSLEKPLALAD